MKSVLWLFSLLLFAGAWSAFEQKDVWMAIWVFSLGSLSGALIAGLRKP